MPSPQDDPPKKVFDPDTPSGTALSFLIAGVLIVMGLGLIYFAAYPIVAYLLDTTHAALQLDAGLLLVLLFAPLGALLIRGGVLQMAAAVGHDTGLLIPWPFAALVFGATTLPVLALVVVDPTALVATTFRIVTLVVGLLIMSTATLLLWWRQTG